MALRIGMIGPGRMGRAHLDRLNTVIAGGELVAVSDVVPAVLDMVSEQYGVKGYSTGAELIADPDVDAVMICSLGPAHEPDVIACIEAGKPVFCEKPLTPDAAGSLAIMEAEQKAGKRFVTVGFVRRFDPSYLEMKALLDEGELGEALMMHCAHRNPTVPEVYTWDMAINDTAIHEIDICRWLLGEEIVSVRVDKPKKTSKRFDHLQDPLVLIMNTESGVRIDDEIFVNCQYGYDIRCELVGELGTVALGDQEKVVRRTAQHTMNAVSRGHDDRFPQGFIAEVQEWISASAAGTTQGPSAWDGYAAACVCDAGVQALTSGGEVAVQMIEKPAFYAS